MSRPEPPFLIGANMSRPSLVAFLRISNLSWIRPQLDAWGDVVDMLSHMVRDVVLVAGNGLGPGGRCS